MIAYSQYSSIVHKKSSDKAYDGDPETNVGEERPVPGLKQQLKYNRKNIKIVVCFYYTFEDNSRIMNKF